MAQSKILVDTNAYLRLARNIKPLLFVPFGNDEYCLYVIPELNEELKNKRLATKFPWVDEDEYRNDRQHYPSVSHKQRKSIRETFEHVWYHIQTELPGPSRVDALYIAYAIELNVHVVTDDEDMIALANAFDAKVTRTLELLKLMLDSGHVDITKINAVVGYWRYIGDTPGQLIAQYRRLFGRDPP
jgi:hypothetical protein